MASRGASLALFLVLFGFLAGGAGAVLFLRFRRGIPPAKRLVLGRRTRRMHGAIFPWTDASAEFAFSPACAGICGSICAAVFRKQLLTAQRPVQS
jgi:hypothetical protein